MRKLCALALVAGFCQAIAGAAPPGKAERPRLTLEKLREMDPLELARSVKSACDRHPDYTAIFQRQERIGGVLKDPEAAEIRLRSKPFSVHVKWTEGVHKGKEALYFEGRWGGAMALNISPKLPVLYVDPGAKELAAHTRHPITQTGLGYLGSRMVEQIEAARKAGELDWKVMEAEKLDGRLTFKVRRKLEGGGFRYWNLDAETWLPVRVWSTDGDGNLAERYTYRDLDFDVKLADDDFDPAKVW